MAIAQRWLASTLHKGDYTPFDYRIYAFCGDGDLMEGVSNEAASVAGHLGLSNLIWFYDNNHITIEGHTSLAFTDDVATRFEGWHWNILHVTDVNDLNLVDVAIRAAQRSRIAQRSSSAIRILGGDLRTVKIPRKPTARPWESMKFAKRRSSTGGRPMRSSLFPTK